MKHHLVKIDGALFTIGSLIANENTRCAGLTVLGKAIELATPAMQV